MDGRGGLRLALCLLSGAVGCQHQATTLSPTGTALSMPKPEAAPDPSQIKNASAAAERTAARRAGVVGRFQGR